MFSSWYSSSSPQKNKEKSKANDNLQLPLHNIGTSATNGNGVTSNLRRLSGASTTSRVRFQDEGETSPISGRSGRQSVDAERDNKNLAPPKSGQTSASRTSPSPSPSRSRDPKTQYDGLFDVRDKDLNDEDMTRIQAGVHAMSMEKAPFVKAMIPGHDSSKRPPDNYYDPFTGELTAKLTPLADGDNKDRERVREDFGGPGSFESQHTSSAIWSQLAKIRDLQSNISNMHIQMEGVGVSGHHSRPFHRRNLSAVDLGLEFSMMEELDTNVDSGGLNALGTDPEVDFDRLAGKLKGREDQIEKIMDTVSSTRLLYSPTHITILARRSVEGYARLS